MCGIFGIIATSISTCNKESLRLYTSYLFNLSESRGKEAAGLALSIDNKINVFKRDTSASELIKSKEYIKLFEAIPEKNGKLVNAVAIIGHSRLVTNGMEVIQSNNQPVIKDDYVCVHNGIIVNDSKLWTKHIDLHREFEVDTEIILALISKFTQKGMTLEGALHQIFKNEVEGTASLALLGSNIDKLVLATNNGSLYILANKKAGQIFFASERYILEEFAKNFGNPKNLQDPIKNAKLIPVLPMETFFIDLKNAELTRTLLDKKLSYKESYKKIDKKNFFITTRKIFNFSDRDNPGNANLKRCVKCILPETMPFIEFDRAGVCNYCNSYELIQPLGFKALNKAIKPYRKNGKEPDCFIAMSGGRDSCFGLHILCEELNLKPISFTYDWGLITDLARRNQARLCGKLGIEHIIVSADIKKKREYVRKNIEAWLKSPDLGMIPLFMAGDKQYFYYAKKVKEQNNLKISFLCENKLERAKFKSGFCGINEGKRRLFNLSIAEKFNLLKYYGKQYFVNPSYINNSLLDSALAFYSSYFAKHDEHLQLFDFIRWNEKELVSTLISKYDWELADDTKSTWRIGDGTAAFYNYIYYTVAGFTENDALRSNQIREGDMTREEALKLVQIENQPRWSSLLWYSHTIGFNLNDALRIINKIPRLYST